MARPPAKPALALVALLTAVLAIALATSVSGAATASKRAKKCTHGRVLVKVNKKSTCRPLRSVLPKPRAGDRTLIALRGALAVDVSTLKGRHGKRARKLPRRAAVAARKARKKLLRALPAALRMLADRREAHASAGRCGGPGSAQPVGDPGHTPGAGIQPLVGPNGEEGAAITVPVNGFTFKMTFVKCGNGTYYVLGCPKSNGDANTSSTGSLDVTERIMEGSTLIRQESTSWKYDDRLLGKVMEDAHLRHFDFRRKEERLRVATGGFVQQGTATRTIRVNMPSGQYDVQHSSTSITGDADAFNADDLAASIKMAIEEYKEAENGGSFLHTDGWATENRQRDPYCAKAVFDPVSEAVRLSKGQAKTVSVYAQGNDGGRAAGARWTVMDPSNAVFTPSSPSGANPTINYTVSNSPSGDHVRVTLKFTSTAGVGKDTWTQPIGVLYRGTVSGTRGVHGTGCNPTWEFTYSASLRESGAGDHPFPILYPPDPFNGLEYGGAAGYGETLSGMYDLPPCDGHPGCSTELTRSGDYGVLLISATGDQIDVEMDVGPISTDCVYLSEVLGTGAFARSQIGDETISVPLTFNSDEVYGNGTLTLNRVN